MQTCTRNAKSSLLIATLTLAFKAQAGGVGLYEIGSDDVALAAAGFSARAQDPSTIYTNPAGMTRLQGNQTFIAGQLSYTDIDFSLDSASSFFLQRDEGGNPIGLIPSGSFFYHYSVTDKLKAGVGIYSNLQSIVHYHGDWVGRYHVVKSSIVNAAIQPTMAYRFRKGISVGGGPVIMFGVYRTKTAINNVPFSVADFHDGELKLSDKDWGMGANLGILAEFNECTRAGLSYTSRVKLHFTPVTTYTDLAPNLTNLLRDNALLTAPINIDIEIPQQIMASIFHQLNPRTAVLASLGWQDWDKFNDPIIGLNSTNPRSVTTNYSFDNTWHLAAGMQYYFTPKCLLNFGVGYDSDFQSNNIALNLPTNSAWRFGFGTKVAPRKNIDVGTSFEYIYGGTLYVNSQSVMRGSIIGEFDHVNTYIISVNANFKNT